MRPPTCLTASGTIGGFFSHHRPISRIVPVQELEILGRVRFLFLLWLDPAMLGNAFKYFAKAFVSEPLQSGESITVLVVEAAVAEQRSLVDFDCAKTIFAAR